ncbi:MAG: Wzz/FepE/Etk N-terminal domain-containing protein [Candidatus Eisenbacteria bacterium]
MSSQDTTVDLKHYARMIWRHKGIIALCPVIALCATLIALSFIPNEYEAKMTLAVEDPGLVSRDVVDLTGGIMQPPTGYRVDEERMARLSGQILSRAFLERLVRMLKMNEDPLVRSMAQERLAGSSAISLDDMAIRILVEDLQSRISFDTKGPGIYQIIVSAPSGSNAQLLAWWTGELFVDITEQQAFESIQNAETFAQDLLGRYDERLRNSEEALQLARRGIIGRGLTQTIVRNENLSSAEALLRRIENEASQARIRARAYEDSLDKHGRATDRAALTADPRAGELQTRLVATLWSEASNHIARGAAVDAANWPPADTYRALRRDLLESAEAVAASLYPRATPATMGLLAGYLFSNIDAGAQQAVALELTDAIAKFRRSAESTPGGEIELSRRQSEVERNRRLREKVEDYIVGTDVRRSIETAELGVRITVLDPPGLPMAPVRPNRPKILIASILLGALLGAGFAFALEVMDPIARTLEDFGRICPEPILGVTPLLSRRLQQPQGRLQRHWLLIIVAAFMFLTGGVLLARKQMLPKLTSAGIPVQIVEPGMDVHENR